MKYICTALKVTKHILTIALLVVVAAFLTSCGSSKKTVSGGKMTVDQFINRDSGGKSTKRSNSNDGSGKSSSGGSLSSISQKLGIQVTSSDNQKLYSEAASWIGTPYKYGGTSRAGVDCSGFTYIMYKTVYGKTISRQSGEILSKNCNRIKKSELRAGDLVFFRTDGKNSSTPNHVGVYLKNGKFVHASTSKGVVVSELDSDYYMRTWIAGGRVR